MSEIELKGCPFCGHKKPRYHNTGVHWFGCDACQCEGPMQSTMAEARAAWNTRSETTALTAQQEQIAALEAVVNAFIEKHCSGPKGQPLTVCSSPSLDAWNQLRDASRAALSHKEEQSR